MRKDFDFVTIDDHRADMAELGQLARSAIDERSREVRQLRALIYAIVKAQGGRIDISKYDLEHMRDEGGDLVIITELSRMRMIVEAVPRERREGMAV